MEYCAFYSYSLESYELFVIGDGVWGSRRDEDW